VIIVGQTHQHKACNNNNNIKGFDEQAGNGMLGTYKLNITSSCESHKTSKRVEGNAEIIFYSLSMLASSMLH
jgi:hypothetical protein